MTPAPEPDPRLRALIQHHGNAARAAEVLGVEHSTLRQWLRRRVPDAHEQTVRDAFLALPADSYQRDPGRALREAWAAPYTPEPAPEPDAPPPPWEGLPPAVAALSRAWPADLDRVPPDSIGHATTWAHRARTWARATLGGEVRSGDGLLLLRVPLDHPRPPRIVTWGWALPGNAGRVLVLHGEDDGGPIDRAAGVEWCASADVAPHLAIQGAPEIAIAPVEALVSWFHWTSWSRRMRVR